MVWTGGWAALETMAGLSSGQFLCGFHITPRLLLDQLSLGFHCLPVYHRHAIRLALLLGAWLRAGLVHPRRHQRHHQREDRAMRATGPKHGVSDSNLNLTENSAELRTSSLLSEQCAK